MMLKLWNRNKKHHKRLAAKWKQNRLWRDGHRHIKVVEDIDRNEIRIDMPLGAASLPPVPNACNYKIRGAIALMLADPPRPDCEPWDDTPQARDSAAFATRLLTLNASEAGLNIDATFAQALDVAGTYASAFTLVGYDPKGGGLQPRTVKAHPDAKHEQEAEVGPEGASPKAPVSRYVMPDGSLSQNSKGAAREWVPKLVLTTLTGNNVRLLPRNATGIDDAEGVVVAMWSTIGQLKARYPRVASMSPEQWFELVRYRIDEWKRLLPEGVEYDADVKEDNPDQGPDDDQMVLTFHVYYRSTPEYPYGCYACFGGGKYRLHKQAWYAQTPDGKDGEQDELLDIPVAQLRWWSDFQGGNPYGKAPPESLGPMDEMRASQYGAQLEYLFRFSRPRPYLPMGTTVQPDDLADLDKPIYVPPGGQPYFPPIPDFPQMGMMLVDRIDREMDNEMSVSDQSRGQSAGSVRSAEQQKTIIEQSLAGTAVFRAACEDYYERLNRLVLQNLRAWCKTAQLMRYQGDGGAFMEEEFTNLKLGNTQTVRVRRGTMSQMAPTAKDGLIIEKMQAGLIPPEEAVRLARENMSPYLGLTEDPIIERVKRHLWLWRQGPTEEQVQQAQVIAQQQQAEFAQQQAMQASMPPAGMVGGGVEPGGMEPPMTPMLPPPDPLVAMAESVFAENAVDQEQMVAQKRHLELQRAAAEAEQGGHPEPWVQGLLNVYVRNRQAAGIQTIAEQQMAMQQQAQQQQAQQAGQQQAEAASEAGERESQASDKQADRSAMTEVESIKQAGATEREQLKAAMQAQGAP